MALSTKTFAPGTVSGRLMPPLENGDRLARTEFERRYAAMPHLKKAELIEGIVYVPSPVRHRFHGEPQSYVTGWFVLYKASTPGVQVSDNSTVRLDLDNEPQPDAVLLIAPERGGQTLLSEDGYIEGAPELVVEVASSRASYDLHSKLPVYCCNGVREYVVRRVLDEEVDWFVLRDSQHQACRQCQHSQLQRHLKIRLDGSEGFGFGHVQHDFHKASDL